MPFAGYEDFQDCVSDNQDKNDPDAYCAAIKREVEGESSLTDTEADAYQRLTTTSDDGGPAALAQFRNPAEIRRVETGNTVRYKRVMLLSPGTWTDAGSENTIDYTPDGIRASADNWVDIDAVRREVPEWGRLNNRERAQRLAETDTDTISADAVPVNFLHGPSLYGADSLDEVGEIPTDSIIVDDDGRLYGDLVMDGGSPQSETAIELMDEVLEAAQEPGEQAPPVGPSVEIPADRVRETDRGTHELEEAWFSATGVVFNPASRPVELSAQAKRRQVAMQAAGGAADGSEGVVYRSDIESGGRGDMFLRRLRHRLGMASTGSDGEGGEGLPSYDDLSDDDLKATLQTMEDEMSELKRALQDFGVAQDVLERARQEGFEFGEQTVDELMEFLGDMDLSDDEMAAVEDTADAFLQVEEADDVSAVSAEAFMDYAVEQAGTGGDEEEEGEGDEEEGSELEGPSMEDLEAVKETLGEFADHMSDIKDMLQAREEDRREELEELERRLSSVEDEPVRQGVEDVDGGEFYSGGDGDGAGDAGRHEDVALDF